MVGDSRGESTPVAALDGWHTIAAADVRIAAGEVLGSMTDRMLGVSGESTGRGSHGESNSSGRKSSGAL